LSERAEEVFPASRIVPAGRPLLDVELTWGRDPLPAASSLRGRIVRTRVSVPADALGRWEAGGAEALREALAAAAWAYPPEVSLPRGDLPAGASRRVLEASDPEGQLREHVAALGLPEADAALAVEAGLDVIRAAGLA
jgi:hypothetical protein